MFPYTLSQQENKLMRSFLCKNTGNIKVLLLRSTRPFTSLQNTEFLIFVSAVTASSPLSVTRPLSLIKKPRQEMIKLLFHDIGCLCLCQDLASHGNNFTSETDSTSLPSQVEWYSGPTETPRPKNEQRWHLEVISILQDVNASVFG